MARQMEPPVGFTPTSLSSTDNALFLELQRLMVGYNGVEPLFDAYQASVLTVGRISHVK